MTVKRYDFKNYGTIESDGRYVKHEDYVELQRKVEALVVESVAARNAVQTFCDVVHSNTDVICEEIGQDGIKAILYAMSATGNLPATDAALVEIRNQARAEGINFAASRLAAAFNHGFVEKPMAEVFDITRMILDARGDLANGLTPPADGLSGEYAESALKKWEEQLNKESCQ